MADKVTDNEIIEALELFKNIDDNDITTASFKTKLLKEIYFLINRLKAEKEKCESQMKLLEAFLNDYKLAYEKAKVEIERFKDIESTISEFWTGLEKLSIFKGKDKPTLEELLEYIEQKDEEIERLQKDKADIIDAVEYRINQAKEFAYKKFAEKLKENEIDIDVSYGYGREHYTKAVPTIVIDNLLAELTPTLNKLPHNSLCETDTYEG